MAWPAEVQLATIAFGGNARPDGTPIPAMAQVFGEFDGVGRVTWEATGETMAKRLGAVYTPAGEVGEITLPIVDQAGWVSEDQAPVTMWRYRIVVTEQGRTRTKYAYPVAGGSPYDFDLLPSGTSSEIEVGLPPLLQDLTEAVDAAAASAAQAGVSAASASTSAGTATTKAGEAASSAASAVSAASQVGTAAQAAQDAAAAASGSASSAGDAATLAGTRSAAATSAATAASSAASAAETARSGAVAARDDSVAAQSAAAASAGSASTSAGDATAAAGTASAAAGTASTAASDAAGSAAAAATSAGNAATSAAAAAGSANTASEAATAAEVARDEAVAAGGGGGLKVYADAAEINAETEAAQGVAYLPDVAVLIPGLDAGIGSTVLVDSYLTNGGYGGATPESPTAFAPLVQDATFYQGTEPLQYRRYRYWDGSTWGGWFAWSKIEDYPVYGPLSRTANTTIFANQRDRVIRMNSGLARTITLPAAASDPALLAGMRWMVQRVGTGSVTLVPAAGVTLINPYSSASLRAVGSMGTIVQVGANTYAIEGDFGDDLAIAAGSAMNPHTDPNAPRNAALPKNWYWTTTQPTTWITGDQWIQRTS